MTREEKEQTGKYVLQMARLLEDGCYQQEMLLKAVHIIDEALEQEPRWIPVSERLPEPDVEVLVTDDAGGLATVSTDAIYESEVTGEKE